MTIRASLGHELKRGDLSRSQEVVAPRLIRQPAGSMTALCVLLGRTPVINPFLYILDVVDQPRATGLEVAEFVLDPVAANGSDVLGLAVFGLADLPIDLAEMKINTPAIESSSERRSRKPTLCHPAPCPDASCRSPRLFRRGTCRPIQK